MGKGTCRRDRYHTAMLTNVFPGHEKPETDSGSDDDNQLEISFNRSLICRRPDSHMCFFLSFFPFVYLEM